MIREYFKALFEPWVSNKRIVDMASALILESLKCLEQGEQKSKSQFPPSPPQIF